MPFVFSRSDPEWMNRQKVGSILIRKWLELAHGGERHAAVVTAV